MRNKKIIFIEVVSHHVVLSSIYHISRYFSKWKPIVITIFTLYKKAKLKEEEKVKIIKLRDFHHNYWISLSHWKKIFYLPRLCLEMKKDGEKLLKIIKKEKPKVIVINTLVTYSFVTYFYFYPLFRWIKKSNSKISLVVILHNTYRWGTKYFIKNANIREIRDGVWIWLIFNLLTRKYIRGIIKLGEYIKLPKTFRNIKFFTLPPRLPSSNYSSVQKPTGRVYFVIPGRVSQSAGKDYISVLQAFKNILEKNSYKDKIELLLLGKIVDKEVENMIKTNHLQKIVKYYHDFVGEEEYNFWLFKSHFAIIPTIPRSPYGEYKVSASLGDAFANALPVLLPDTYAPHYGFDKNVIRFSWENMEDAIKQAMEMVLFSPQEYHKIQNIAEKVRESLNPSKIAPQLEEFLDGIIKN